MLYLYLVSGKTNVLKTPNWSPMRSLACTTCTLATYLCIDVRMICR